MTETTTAARGAVRRTVREGYAGIAAGDQQRCCGEGGCCGGMSPDAVAEVVGYSVEELAALPHGANMGLSCGNPTALAELQPGETVLDLGSGGGFDVFLAGRRVGAAGRAIGVDMTPEMLEKARAGVSGYRETTGLDNVEFRLGEIEHLPLADASVDVVISNCAINLSPDKDQVWRELTRVLRPGGRVAVSDLALTEPLPAGVTEMVEALVGCVAGAVFVDDTRRLAAAAGLVDIELRPRRAYVAAMDRWQDPLYQRLTEHLPAGKRIGDYITSLEIRASKPGGCGGGCCGGGD